MRTKSAGRAAAVLPGTKGYRVNAWVDVYTDWLIRNLVGTKGRNRTDVATTLIREWVVTNHTYLERLGLWPPEVRAGKAVVIPPGA